MKSIFQILIIATAFSIVACAKNVTNTNSDPLRGYENLGNDVPLDQRIKDQTLPAKEDDGDPKACPKPYKLSFTQDGKDIGRDWNFIVGQKKVIMINIASDFPNLTVQSFNKPDNASLDQVKGGYTLTFQPKPEQVNPSIKMTISVNVPQTGCFKGNIPEQFKIRISSGKIRPIISKVEIDQGKIYKNTDVVSFTVDVTDPSVANAERPKAPSFEATTAFPTDEVLALDTKNAFDGCPTHSSVNATTERFTCKLDLSLGKLVASNRKDKSVATAGFSILAQSVTGEISIKIPVSLNLQYLEAQAPTADPAPAAPATLKVPPKTSTKKTTTASAKPGARS